MKCIALQHVAFEDLGLFADGLRHAGYEIDYHQAGIAPVEADEWRDADLVVVLGGPIAAYDSALFRSCSTRSPESGRAWNGGVPPWACAWARS